MSVQCTMAGKKLADMPIDLKNMQVIHAKIIHLDRYMDQREVQVVLAEDPNGDQFEAWFANSAWALKQSEQLTEGENVVLKGYRCKPVRSHRDHGGRHVPGEDMPFFTVSEIP